MKGSLFSSLFFICLFGFGQEDYKLPLGEFSWQQKNSFGGGPRDDGSTFVIDGKGYYGCGADFGFQIRNDWWSYNLERDTWSEVANLPDRPRQYALGFNSASNGFLVSGILDDGQYSSQCFKYAPLTNEWVQLSDAPFEERAKSAGFRIGSTYYLGGGVSDSSIYNDFWAFDLDTEKWRLIGSLPFSGRYDMIGFSYLNFGYLGLGANSHETFRELWRFDLSREQWELISQFPGMATTYSCAIAESGGAVVFGGMNDSGGLVSEVYHYSAYHNIWTKLDSIPSGKLRGIEGFVLDNHMVIIGGLAKNFTRLSTVQALQFAASRLNSNLIIWPIPARSEVSFQCISNSLNLVGLVEIIDSKGTLILSKQVVNLTKVNTVKLDDLENGIYYLRIVSESEIFVRSIVVSN